ILSGLMLGGGLLGIGDGDVGELRVLYIPMVTYLLFAVIGPRMVSLHHLDALPISRRSMAAALILPYLGLLCAGYGAGVLVSSGTRSAIEYVNFEERTNGYRVTVPLRVYHVAWDGCPRSVESPQGEVHTPEPLAPFRWSRAAVYSPYSAPVGSSAAFVALQISRAVQEVYGVSIPSATIEQRYLTTTEAGRVVPRGGEGLTLRADHPELKAGVGPMFPALITLTVVPWLLLVALLLRAYRPGVREWIRQTVVWGSLGVLLLFWLATSMSTVFQVMEPWGLRALVEIAVFGLGSTTGGTATVWLLALLLLAGAYWIAQSRFLRMEIPTHPSRYTLLGSR
ncbi:MAG: hypothetical protein QF681_00380, partial [Vicinamibacterales bacterium]|nr:hypothetical protein [Vicinamibacterales bacterium]